MVQVLREEKDEAHSESQRAKSLMQQRVEEVSSECNVKLAKAEEAVIEARERHRFHEEKAFQVMQLQERLTEKWRQEHRQTVECFGRQIEALKRDKRSLEEKVVELKGLLRIEKENHQDDGNAKKKHSSKTSKSKEKKV